MTNLRELSVLSPTPEGWGTRVATFERNIAALRRMQPDLADRLRELPIPPDVEPALGRDGSPTFRMADGNGQKCWLGGSSMPTISAPAVLERFDAFQVNVLAPTAATGHELQLLCGRMPPYVAVFVHEVNPLNLKLVLHAVDLSGPLAAGRLVPLAFAAIEEAMPAFLARHPGYDLPSKMLAHPTVPPAEIDRLRSASETISAIVAPRQRQSARELAAALTAASAERAEHRLTESPRVAVFSADARPAAIETARHLVQGLIDLGWPAAASIPDSPWACHPLARLALVREHRPDVVVFLNGCAGSMTEFLPPELPVVSWFWPGVDLSKPLIEGAAAHHHLVATEPDQLVQLRRLGVAAARLHLLEVGVDTNVYRPVRIAPQRRERLACDVAILADAVPASAAALGITLESHARLWDRLTALLAERAPTYQPAMAPDLVREAERATGVELDSDELRERIVRLTQNPLAGRVVPAAMATYLRGFGVHVRVWGAGWAEVAEVAEVHAGPIPDPSERNEIHQSAAIVVLPLAQSAAPISALEVLASGGIPVVPADSVGPPAAHPQLGGILGKIPHFSRFKEVLSLLREASAPDKTLKERMAALSQTVIRSHGLKSRWESIRDLLAAGVGTPPVGGAVGRRP